MQLSLAAGAGIPVEQLDLIDLSAAGLAMREQVANHGLLLKGDNSLAWSHFLVRTWRELEEFAWEQATQLDIYQAETTAAVKQDLILQEARQNLVRAGSLSALEFWCACLAGAGGKCHWQSQALAERR